MANPLRNAVGRLRSGVDPRSVAIGALLDQLVERLLPDAEGAPGPGSPAIRAEGSFRADAGDFERRQAVAELHEDRLHAMAFLDDQDLVDAALFDLEGNQLSGHHHHRPRHRHDCGCGDCD